jgi:hypothetical protein
MINQPTLNQRIKAQQAEHAANQTNPPRQPLTPRGRYSTTEAHAHSMIAGEVLRWLDQIPHYCDTGDTEYYLDWHDVDRVLEVIRRLGHQGLLKFDKADSVNAD